MNRTFILVFFWSACLLMAPSPVSSAQQSAQVVVASPVAETGPVVDFRLSPGDAIEVRFFYNPELDTRVQLRPDGHISMALAGEVDLTNRTVLEATRDLEAAYGRVLRTPAITIHLVSYAGQKVYVGGEVPRPGVVELPGRMTVMEAIMEAGGIRNTGRTSSVVLIRRSPDETPVSRTVSYRGTRDRPSEAAQLQLRPYDVIVVPESRVAHLDRWIDQYIRQVIPINTSAGFSYLANAAVLAR